LDNKKKDTIEKINLALEEIRPFLLDDGGDIELIELTEDLVVKVKFLGACKACSMSPMTLKGGVEDAIKRKIPEIKEVITIEDTLIV
jgi:Fe-S cluster biogenesis protein NfuA